MVLMITVIAIVVAFSLYDYFQSRSWQSVTSTLRNDEVFENRNKAYGAYQIRKDYNKRLVLIMLSMFGGLGALWGATHLFKHKIEDTKKDRIQIVQILKDFDDDKEPEKEKIEPEKVSDPEPPAAIEQTKFVVPHVTDSIIHDADIKIPDGDTKIGDKDIKGDGKDPFDIPPPDGKGGDGKGIDRTKPVPEIPEIVDEQAMYPGGISAMRKFIADNIDLTNVDGGSKLYMKFVVDEKGEISRVSVTKATKECPSCEKAAIKVIKEMPKWTPGKINGEPVKSYYRIPITILE